MTWEYGRQKEIHWTPSEKGDTLIIENEKRIYSRKHELSTVQRIQFDLESITPISRNWIAFVGGHGGEIHSPGKFIPYSEHFRFGGLRTVRGYEEDFFSGTRVAWVNLEMRFVTADNSRVFVFLDQGYYSFRNNQQLSFRDTPRGIGVGIRYQTRAGFFSLDYGLGKHDTFFTGKIHFGMLTQF